MDRLGTTPEANWGSRTSDIQKGNYIHGDADEQLKTAIQDAGLNAPEHIITGKIIAFPGRGKPKHNKAARCFMFTDRLGGWFMDYSTGLFEVWQAKHRKPYTEQEYQAFKKQCERDRLAREQETAKAHQQTAEKARRIWKRAINADSGNGYLRLKKVQAHGTKTGDFGSLKDILIAPIYDESLKLVNLQFIDQSGQKRFLACGQKKNCFWWIGKKTINVLIAEGFSTAASLYEATGLQTLCDKRSLSFLAR